MPSYGITQDYEYSATHKRDRLMIWSGPFFSVFESEAYTLPKADGYMLTTYNGDRVRVSCPAPRNEDNWQEVDKALGEALEAHYKAIGATSVLSTS